MVQGKIYNYNVNVTGMTPDQFKWVINKAKTAGLNRAAIIKALITAAMEIEAKG